MDPQTAMVILQLQLADIEELLDSISSTNERASLEVIQQDLTTQLATLGSELLVIRILKVEHNDRVSYRKLLDEEKQATGDHELALKMAGISTDDSATTSGTYRESQLGDKDNDKAETQW